MTGAHDGVAAAAAAAVITTTTGARKAVAIAFNQPCHGRAHADPQFAWNQ